MWVVTVVFRPINLYVIACTFLTSFYVFSKSKKRDFLRFLPCALFLRYGDLLAENCEFFLPHSHLTPSLVVNPFEFLDEFFIPKTREDWKAKPSRISEGISMVSGEVVAQEMLLRQ